MICASQSPVLASKLLARQWALICVALSLQAADAGAAPMVPGFAELEAAGAIVGEIRITPQNVFNLDDAAENNSLFRLINRLHVPTRPDVIARALLFRTGERISRQKIEETERLLRSSRTRYDVEIAPIAYRNGVVDIGVSTRDTWTLDLTGNFSRSGGANKTSFGIRERNIAGTGGSIGFTRTSDLDRKGEELEMAYPQAFDGWTSIEFMRGRFNDGKRTSFIADRPFYALDARFAVRGAWADDDRIDSIYNAGVMVSEYRHRVRRAEISAGRSAGLIDGWVQRFTAGATIQDHIYRVEPGRNAPAHFPVDNDLRSVFLRVDLLEDAYLKVKNFNLIERAEFIVLGFNARLQLEKSLMPLGSTRADWLYSMSVSDGYVLSSNHILQAGVSAERRMATTGRPMTRSGASVKYYMPQAARSLTYASLVVDQSRGGGIADQLLIGGTQGLRGYPARYQAGEQRFVFSLEKRAFTAWYPFRLFRVGGAAFFDCGRAWGGPNQNLVNGGTLADVGIGLRLALDRAAFANILHVDVAAPLNHAPGIKPVQFLVKTEFSF